MGMPADIEPPRAEAAGEAPEQAPRRVTAPLPPEDTSALFRSFLGYLLTAGLLTIADALFALQPWLAIPMTAASILVVPVWARAGLQLLRLEAEEHDMRKVRIGRSTPYVVLSLIGLLLCVSLAAKAWLVWLSWTAKAPAAYVVSYRTYGVAAYVLAALGLIGRPRRLARFLAQVAEHHARLMVMTFGVTALLGAFVLTLPISLRDAADASFVDALFTSVSALCVTGLAVNVLPETYSFFGQAVILALIQVGGLGIMVLYSFFGVLAGRRLRVQHTAVMAEMLDVQSLASLRRAVGGIVVVTLCIEAVGALALYYFFLSYPETGLGIEAGGPIAGAGDRVWAAVFHAVSAFCNAGFSLFPANLAPFVSSYAVCLTIAGLVVLGGLGFPVHFELLRALWWRMRGRRAPRLSLHARTVFVTSAVLLVIGCLGTAVLEGHNVLYAHDPGTRILAGFFHSAVSRTAGFNSIDIGALAPATLLLTGLLMFVGGSPGSTAGGIKTTTLAVLFATFRAELRHEAQTNLGGRTLSNSTTRRALGVALLSLAFVFLLLFCLLLVEDHAPHALAFEVVSALATVGLSMGVTAKLSTAGKLIVALAMFVGRIGPLTLALLLEKQARRAQLSFPEEHVGIG